MVAELLVCTWQQLQKPSEDQSFANASRIRRSNVRRNDRMV
jgi:hypothetical protein